MDKHQLQIKDLVWSKNYMQLDLIIPDLREKYVVHLSLSPELRSEDEESLWSGDVWYTLNNIPKSEPL